MKELKNLIETLEVWIFQGAIKTQGTARRKDLLKLVEAMKSELTEAENLHVSAVRNSNCNEECTYLESEVNPDMEICHRHLIGRPKADRG